MQCRDDAPASNCTESQGTEPQGSGLSPGPGRGVRSQTMRAPSLLLVAVGLGCSFETGSAVVESGELVETGTETADGSTTQISTSASGSGSGGATGTSVTTDPELTSSGEASDTDEATAFVQQLVVTEARNYNFNAVPVLVTLTSENTRWDAIEPDLSNLRFTGRDGGSEVEFPFEVAGVGEESAQLWVRLPEVSPSADRFQVEYGVGVSPDAWAPGDVWPAYEAVWHLGEDPTDREPQYRDSSGNERHIANREKDRIPSTEMVRGIVGRAPRFAQGRELQLPHSDWPESNIGDRFTLEAWVQYEEPPPRSYRSIVQKNGAYRLVGSRNQRDPLEVPAWGVHDGSGFHFASAPGKMSWNQGGGVWNYAAATFEYDGGSNQVRTQLYIDGIEVASSVTPAYDPTQTQSDFRIGSNLTAVVDEVRVSFEVRPPEWFELQNRSMRDKLLEYGDAIPLE